MLWDAEDDWTQYDALVLRSCWDYHLRPHDFTQWLDRVEHDGVALWNPGAVVRWNLHKRYLRDLERAGVRIPETVWLDHGDRRTLADVMGQQGWSECVVKPAVSASATHTWRVRKDDVASVPRPAGVTIVPPAFGGAGSRATLPMPMSADLSLSQRADARKANAEGKPVEFFGGSALLAFTYATAEESGGVASVGYYSRDLFETDCQVFFVTTGLTFPGEQL